MTDLAALAVVRYTLAVVAGMGLMAAAVTATHWREHGDIFQAGRRRGCAEARP